MILILGTVIGLVLAFILGVVIGAHNADKEKQVALKAKTDAELMLAATRSVLEHLRDKASAAGIKL